MVFSNCCGTRRDVASNNVDDSAATKELTIHNDASDEKQTEHKKEKWGSDVEFFLSCVGYGVGLGNIWRFPYLCLRNGGGAFVIAYFTFMIISGIPLYLLELCVGQYSGKSPIAAFEALCPISAGLGWAMLIPSAFCLVYLNSIMNWILYYFGMTFVSWDPVWGRCDNAWNTPNCVVTGQQSVNHTNQTALMNETTTNYSPSNISFVSSNESSLKAMSSGEEFWQYNVLELTDGIGNFGGFRWELIVCHLAAWFIVYVCLCRGVKSSGKVIYVTATAPYVCLVALLIRGVTLPGAVDGIMYYIVPDWSKLLSVKIWAEACLQIYYSIGPGWGGLITMASYNRFNNNIYRDAIVIPVLTCFTSFFAGFVTFSIIGHLAHQAGVTVSEALTSGPGLAFIVFPMAISKIPGAPIWSGLFFLMLLTVGLDTQFVMMETLVTALMDKYTILRKRKSLFILFIVVVCVLVGLLFCCRGGMYWFQLLDWYAGMFTLLIVSTLECVVVSYIYGMNRMYDDIEAMIGYRPSCFMKALWCSITPIITTVMLVYVIVQQVPAYYGDYFYPDWAVGIGWFIATISTVPILLFFCKELYNNTGSLIERFKNGLKPTEAWAAATLQNKEETLLPMSDLKIGV
ncbi:sodium- and chloride-dependent glycine transporter 1-like [Tubulanus polymorphus]|uniref:sodium- and chloride-dependent glycine transporter 1-like n=1 Tax=Tubulanus polymorphus TaxID=672921 RepID=UPI003DA4BC4A